METMNAATIIVMIENQIIALKTKRYHFNQYLVNGEPHPEFAADLAKASCLLGLLEKITSVPRETIIERIGDHIASL